MDDKLIEIQKRIEQLRVRLKILNAVNPQYLPVFEQVKWYLDTEMFRKELESLQHDFSNYLLEISADLSDTELDELQSRLNAANGVEP